MANRLYLDHAATTPILPEARDVMVQAMGQWANPSSPHAEGRATRAALENARGRIKASLGWQGHVIFTSGASEALAIAILKAKASGVLTSVVEHEAVLRLTKDAERLVVDSDGVLKVPIASEIQDRTLVVVQHVNNETGVIHPIGDIDRESIILLVDCAQSAGKLPLPDADLIAISAHKFGGPPGIGALLVRDLALLEAVGGQEQGYRGGTENVPAILAMATALEADNNWMNVAVNLRNQLDAAIEDAGGIVVSKAASRSPTIASYRMPGMSARAQLIQFDMAGISVSAGSACSSGSLKISHVLQAMGWDEKDAGEVIRVSFGPQTNEENIHQFLQQWTAMAQRVSL